VRILLVTSLLITYIGRIDNITQPVQLLALPIQAYYQLIHNLAGILPRPVADTPEALLARNQAAVDKVAAMMPTNADEADLAAQVVACRAQAEDVLRLIRLHDGDTRLVTKLDAQYIALVRASTAARRELREVQAVRYRREANSAALKADESTQYIATRLMQQALEAGPVPVAATRQAAPAAAAQRALVPQPAPVVQPPVGTLEVGPTLPQVPGPVAEAQPAPAPPEPAPDARRAHRLAAPAEADDPPRDLPTEADRNALTYPRRAREIRRHGRLPPDCSFGPPDDEVVQAIIAGSSPALRALDDRPATAD